ncbi:hypothetical protein RB596_005832 [Gaeumannomyces avenae]
MATYSAVDKSVDQRIQIIVQALAKHHKVKKELPGLQSLLQDYLAHSIDVTPETFHRRLLSVFKASPDVTFEECLGQLLPDQQARIQQFIDGSPLGEIARGFQTGSSLGVKEHVALMTASDAVHVSSVSPMRVKGSGSCEELRERDGVLYAFATKLEELFRGCIDGDEESGDDVVVYKDARFQNWGRGVDFVPAYTCVPTTVAAIQHIVKYAKAHGMGVRCADFRHSWAPIFGRDKQILISLLPLAEVEMIPNVTALPLPQAPSTELESIEIVKDGIPRVSGNVLVRVGVSTTNERLRRWCVQRNRKYTYPLNVIMVEMTVGGTNGPICHGAGIRHATLSDLVRKVEYVDCNGARRTVTDPEYLRAAAGCFGLMGVITHLTLEFQPMTYALMQPEKLPAVRAVPPPDDMAESEIPPALRVAVTPEERAADIAAFERHCREDYYAEWFWFPYADMCWVNCWNDTPDPAGVIDYPSEAEIFLMFVSQFAMNVIQFAPVLNDLIDATHMQEAAVTLLSRVAMAALPAWETPKKTYLTDALHFQRGIQNVRVLDVEVEMPLVARRQPDAPAAGTAKHDVPDLGLARRAWWDAILVAYRHTDTCPQRMPLEMRIMGGSDMVMAPQRGNALGTCAIEVLTLESARDLWKPYAEEVLAHWLSYKDADGKALRTRSHWAKQWAGLMVDGKPWLERMKTVDYRDELVEFKRLLAEIGKGHGWTLKDLKGRFSNDFFDSFYFDDV